MQKDSLKMVLPCVIYRKLKWRMENVSGFELTGISDVKILYTNFFFLLSSCSLLAAPPFWLPRVWGTDDISTLGVTDVANEEGINTNGKKGNAHTETPEIEKARRPRGGAVWDVE